MSRSTRKRSVVLSLMVILTMLLSACGPGGEPTPTPVQAPEATQAVSEGAPTVTTAAVPPAPDTSTAPKMKNPGTYVAASADIDPESLDPAWAYDSGSSAIIMNIYENLITFKKDKIDEYVPLLASKWDVSADGKSYTFTIRKGIKFHEGQDLTPEDIAYSFWRGLIQDRSGGPQWVLLQPMFGLEVQSFKGDLVEKQHGGDWVAACEAVKKTVTFDNNAGTVTINLKQQFGPMLQILAGAWGWGNAMSKSWVMEKGGWNGDCTTAQQHNDPKPEDNPIMKITNGTGPYKLERWAPGEQITLIRNDNYWLKEPLWEGGPSGPARIERILIKAVEEWGTRFAMLKTADIDFGAVQRQYIEQVQPLVKEECDLAGNCTQVNPNGHLRLYKDLVQNSASAIMFNQKVDAEAGNNRLGSGQLDGNGIPADFFSDVHVRKAFNYCFDWETYINEAYVGEAEQALGPIIKGHLGYDPNQARYSLDLEKCASEFKASTHKAADGKSLWDTGFLLHFVYNTGNDARRIAGEILQANITKVNSKFKIEIVDVPFAEMNKEIQQKRLPLVLGGWLEDYHDPHNWALPYLGSAGSYSGAQGFDQELQEQLDALILQGVQETDPAKRHEIYKQLQNISYENALNIFTVQALGRRYEPVWIHDWYYNSAYPGSYYYSMSKGE